MSFRVAEECRFPKLSWEEVTLSFNGEKALLD